MDECVKVGFFDVQRPYVLAVLHKKGDTLERVPMPEPDKLKSVRAKPSVPRLAAPGAVPDIPRSQPATYHVQQEWDIEDSYGLGHLGERYWMRRRRAMWVVQLSGGVGKEASLSF